MSVVITDIEDTLDIKQPDWYSILILDDDVTAIDFVVDLLIKHCELDFVVASNYALDIDMNGSVTIGCYTLDVLETKLKSMNADIAAAGYPLRCQRRKV